ncbi:hypothetical protein COB64_03895 [Candidatus Wolfebacteria bacterium]|nr:MAG: hypothetical protein COB64_03895 [Candidatus Wolfebacteria bacterium]
MEETPRSINKKERPAYLGELPRDTKQQLADLGWNKDSQIDMSLGYANEIIEAQQVFNKEWYELIQVWGDALGRWDERAPEEMKKTIDVSFSLYGETSEETITRMEKYIKEHKATLSPEAIFFLSMSIQVKKKGLEHQKKNMN